MIKKIFVLTVCLFTVLILGGCKTSDQGYDIRGTWSIAIQLPGTSTHSWTITFTGSESAGNAVDTSFGVNGTGSYTVDNDQVSFEMDYVSDLSFTVTYTGSFSDKNSMNGNLLFSSGETGVCSATR